MLEYWSVVEPTPLKNHGVSWDDDIPNIWKVIKMFQSTNQNWMDLSRLPGCHSK